MDILLFTGLSAAGKSTIARLVNESLKFNFLGEREILHDLAIKAGFARTRDWLAHARSNVLIEAARVETISLIRASKDSKGVIIDGSYDRELPASLAQEFPETNIVLISVLTDDDIRMARMRNRLGSLGDMAEEELGLIDGFKKEVGVEEIIARADITLINNGSLEGSVLRLQEALKQKGISSREFD